ncbi:MerR family transcriptional regulator [Sedimentibacter sp.]|uniref:MerR family transcriptional regulator n=1 Tax=Sedimentibacter sp. TaxID=1960295 RepID=UPI000ED03CB1|nr:MerR family transcriptional regulator [Sedimentibacter sp.]HCX63167.1 MerR family transcriptional regulator [Clostridiales bacterium]
MKDYYKIGEISNLYGIGVDSLRYYERIGVLKPRRGENGYRMYNLKDIYKLNIIRDLRQLNFSMEQIKNYLAHQSIDNTLALLQEEIEWIQGQLKKLRSTEQIIQSRLNALLTARNSTTGIFTVKAFPDRMCLRLNTNITRDEEIDFAIKKLHHKHENKIYDIGNQSIGAALSIDDLNKGITGVFRYVFFILKEKTKEYDFILPAGQYLSFLYKGSYNQSADRIKETLSYIEENGYHILDDPFELYQIHNHDTMLKEEFLTEIQVRISE